MSTCLIADDSKVIRLLLSKIISNLGFSVIEAEDGEDVVELVGQGRSGQLDLTQGAQHHGVQHVDTHVDGLLHYDRQHNGEHLFVKRLVLDQV